MNNVGNVGVAPGSEADSDNDETQGEFGQGYLTLKINQPNRSWEKENRTQEAFGKVPWATTRKEMNEEDISQVHVFDRCLEACLW